jgi:hypothetical protein
MTNLRSKPRFSLHEGVALIALVALSVVIAALFL